MTDCKYYRFLGSLIFHLVNIMYASDDAKPLKNCHEIIEYRYRIKYDVIDTRLENIAPFVCLFCARELDVRRETLELNRIKFPIYNNYFIELSLFGVNFPKKTHVQIMANNNCQFEIDIIPNFKLGKVSITIKECLILDGKQCFVLLTKIINEFYFDNWNCLSLAVAFIDKDKIHFAYSTSCETYANSQFEASKYLNVSQKCFIKNGIDNLNESFKIKEYTVSLGDDGLIIVPLSQGQVASSHTDRFVKGDPCSKNYLQTQTDNNSIILMIKYAQKKLENFYFSKRGRKENNQIPIKNWLNFMGKSLLMKSVIKLPILKNENKSDSEFEDGEVSLIEMEKATERLVVKRQIEASTDEANEPEISDQGLQQLEDDDLIEFHHYLITRINETMENLNESVEGSTQLQLQVHERRLAKVIDEMIARGLKFEDRLYLPCNEETLVEDKLMKQIDNFSLNYFVHRSGCFQCSKPICDFKEENCSKISKIEMPVYNHVFELGFPGSYSPSNATLSITLSDYCMLRVEFLWKDTQVFITMFQCRIGNYNCTHLNIQLNYTMEHNNFYCIQMAFALIFESKVHFATSQFCNKFATMNFDGEKYVLIEEVECQLKNRSHSSLAKLEILQDSLRIYDGVPVILPCSAGGYLVNPRTGVFVTGEWCQQLLQDSHPLQNGLTFLIQNLYNFKEDYFFHREFEADLSYPHPVYLSEDLKFTPTDHRIPFNSTNIDKVNKTRRGCDYIDVNMATVTKRRETTSTTVVTEEENSKIVAITILNEETDPVTEENQENNNINNNSSPVIQSQQREDGGFNPDANFQDYPVLIISSSNHFFLPKILYVKLLILSFYL